MKVWLGSFMSAIKLNVPLMEMEDSQWAGLLAVTNIQYNNDAASSNYIVSVAWCICIPDGLIDTTHKNMYTLQYFTELAFEGFIAVG